MILQLFIHRVPKAKNYKRNHSRIKYNPLTHRIPTDTISIPPRKYVRSNKIERTLLAYILRAWGYRKFYAREMRCEIAWEMC